jgi:DNA polymerase-3 subunit beta
MKFVAERSVLLAALQRAARIAARRTTVPILGNVLLAARKGHLSMTATDMDREVVIEVEAGVDKPGATTVDVRLLTQFVQSLPDGAQVEAALAERKLTVRGGRARIALHVLPEADFPTFTAIQDPQLVSIEGKAFAELLRSVAHAQSDEETRFYLNGIYLHRRGPRELVAVATNGHTLARTVLAVEADLPDFPGAIVPRGIVEELTLLAAEAGTLDLEIAATLLKARAGDVVLSTRLVDGTFPDYERVIPAASIAEGFDAPREDLLRAVKRVGIFDDGSKNRSRPVKFSPDGTALELSAGSADHGETADAIDAKTSTKIPVGMNARYVAAALGALAGTTVKVRYADAGAPIAFTDPADAGRLQIIMAMRV